MKKFLLALLALSSAVIMPSLALADACSCYNRGLSFGATAGGSYQASDIPADCDQDSAISTSPFGYGVFNARDGHQNDAAQFCNVSAPVINAGPSAAPALHWYAQGGFNKVFNKCPDDYPIEVASTNRCLQKCEDGYTGWSLPGNDVCVKCPFQPSNVGHNGDGTFTCYP